MRTALVIVVIIVGLILLGNHQHQEAQNAAATAAAAARGGAPAATTAPAPNPGTSSTVATGGSATTAGRLGQTVNGQPRRPSGKTGTITFKAGEMVMGYSITYNGEQPNYDHPYCPIKAEKDGSVFDGVVNPSIEESHC